MRFCHLSAKTRKVKPLPTPFRSMATSFWDLTGKSQVTIIKKDRCWGGRQASGDGRLQGEKKTALSDVLGRGLSGECHSNALLMLSLFPSSSEIC